MPQLGAASAPAVPKRPTASGGQQKSLLMRLIAVVLTLSVLLLGSMSRKMVATQQETPSVVSTGGVSQNNNQVTVHDNGANAPPPVVAMNPTKKALVTPKRSDTEKAVDVERPINDRRPACGGAFGSALRVYFRNADHPWGRRYPIEDLDDDDQEGARHDHRERALNVDDGRDGIVKAQQGQNIDAIGDTGEGDVNALEASIRSKIEAGATGPLGSFVYALHPLEDNEGGAVVDGRSCSTSGSNNGKDDVVMTRMFIYSPSVEENEAVAAQNEEATQPVGDDDVDVMSDATKQATMKRPFRPKSFCGTAKEDHSYLAAWESVQKFKRHDIRKQEERASSIGNAVTKENPELEAFYRNVLGPDWFEATVITEEGVQHLLFTYYRSRCVYVSQPFRIPKSKTMATPTTTSNKKLPVYAKINVKHLYRGFEAVMETKEEQHYPYVLNNVKPSLSSAGKFGLEAILESGPGFYVLQKWSANVGGAKNAPSKQLAVVTKRRLRHCAQPVWRRGMADKTDYRKTSLGGYWLTYKGIDNSRYSRIPNYELDYLGRLNFGYLYSYGTASKKEGSGLANPDGASPARCSSQTLLPSPAKCDRDCVLDKLRDRTIYFFGDSHMRITFYGFLTKIGISYPMNSVWRGDRTDRIASHNVTVKFIASYFLNMSRPSALEMLKDKSHPIIVAGVGQHHSCHCWSVKKHMSIVKESLEELIAPVDPDRTDSKRKRQVVWFGVPAQPFNTHLYRPKPVGQSRKDCRNNARHLIYSSHQRELMREKEVAFLDTFGYSLGMQHTSLDGAHYYTWARDLWLDALMGLI